MTVNLVPFLRTPFTDLFSAVQTFQDHHQCANHELRAVDCLEAYGLPRGFDTCRVLLNDFDECVAKRKQKARVDIMRAERQRQFDAGERTKQFADDVRIDAY